MFQLPSQAKKEKQATSSRRRPPPNYFSRRERIRLMMLVGMVMLVVILMIEAADPNNWKGILALFAADDPVAADQAGSASAEPGNQKPGNQKIDTRYTPEPKTNELDVPGSFYSPAPKEEHSEDEDEEDVDVPGYFPGVRPSRLEDVEDNTTHYWHKNREGFLHLMEVLHKAQEQDLRAQTTGELTFIQLLNQPAEHRGKLVTVEGTVRRADPMGPPTNDFGVEKLWRYVVHPAGKTRAKSPVFIYALDLPEGFPVAEETRQKITSTGFVYKTEVYAAVGKSGNGESHIAPVIMAKTIHWTPPPPEPPPTPLTTTLIAVLTAVLGTAVLAIAISLYVYSRSRAVSPLAEKYALTERTNPERLKTLKDADVEPDVGERLQNLAEEEATRETGQGEGDDDDG